MLVLDLGPDKPSTTHASVSMTMAFAVVAFTAVNLGFVMRREREAPWSSPLFPYMGWIIPGWFLTWAGVELNMFQRLLDTEPLTGGQWATGLGLSLNRLGEQQRQDRAGHVAQEPRRVGDALVVSPQADLVAAPGYSAEPGCEYIDSPSRGGRAGRGRHDYHPERTGCPRRQRRAAEHVATIGATTVEKPPDFSGGLADQRCCTRSPRTAHGSGCQYLAGMYWWEWSGSR
jgi:hypothetical protein